jgi:hypothetical protein
MESIWVDLDIVWQRDFVQTTMKLQDIEKPEYLNAFSFGNAGVELRDR